MNAGDSGASGSAAVAGKGSGGTTSTSGAGGKAAAGYGGDFEDHEGGSGGKAEGGAGMSGVSGSESGSGSGGGGSGGKGGAGGNGTAGAGGKGGSAGGGGVSGNAGTTSGGAGGSGNDCTPTSSAPIPGISARYQAEGNDDYAVAGKLIIANTGQSTLNLADLKLRYYFTNEVTAALQKTVNWCYYRPNGGGAQQDRAGKVSFDVVPMTCNATGADTYLEFKFTADAGLLEPGYQVYFSWAVHNTASQKFTKTNDYSFDASAQEGNDFQKVVVLQNSGNRVWGTEP